MSEAAILWIIGILIAALFALVGVIWHTLISRIERVEGEIGTHETGIRGACHRMSNKITAIESKVNELDVNKHMRDRRLGEPLD